MRDEHQQSIGRAVLQLRELQGWSQRQLAKWVGLDQSAVSRIEAGRRRVSAKELQLFADTFRVSADALLLGLPGGGEPPASAALEEYAVPLSTPEPYAERPAASLGIDAFAASYDLDLDKAAAFERIGDLEEEPQPHGDIDALEHGDSATPGPRGVSRLIPGVVAHAAQRLDMGDPRLGRVSRALLLRAGRPADLAGSGQPGPAAALARLDSLPAEVAAVVRDWFELRRLAGGHEPALAWSSGHSAEGKPERFAQPVQPAERGSLGGDVLYDRVARFWRSELHVEPDDGPLPDLVPLLEDGLGAQVIVARVAAPSDGPTPNSAERPVCANLTAGATPFLFVNAARPVVLQRFALAHAFAHLVLGHGDVIDARIEWSRNNPREAAANDFAEELLAPVRAVHRWYERRSEPRPEVETMLELGNAFGISAWAALYRSRATRRLHAKQFAALNQRLRRLEWELLPQQAFLGGLRDTLTHLTPGECLPPGEYGRPAVLHVPASMRAWALSAVRGGRLSVERAAACLQLDARELAAQLARLGLE
jgi:transcriptional regulator with XRE-family HTH domain